MGNGGGLIEGTHAFGIIPSMEKLNVILKAFDGDPLDKKLVLERAFRDIPRGTVISVCDKEEGSPTLKADRIIWKYAALFREGRYSEEELNTCAPIDEELIEKMRHYEAVFMDMVDRYANKMTQFQVSGDVPYSERKHLFYANLRYWNHMLDTEKIDLVVMNHEPHQCYDYVLYGLCKVKRIPVLYLARVFTIDTCFIAADWENPAPELAEAYRRVQEEYADVSKPVDLSPNYETYFNLFRNKQPEPWYKPKKVNLTQQGFIARWWRQAWKILRRDPRRFLASMLSRSFWSRKLHQHRAIGFYDRHITVPDLNKPFVYIALHYQPEATTLPLAGAFVEQDRIISLLAACLPPDVKILVKEHPAQGERCRSEEFYRSLLAIPSVQFIPRETDTYTLMDKCVAIATATGTVTFEAILRQKPVLMFGHFAYQYGPGVHRIRSAEDCSRAVHQILQQKESHTVRDVRLFLKALEACATPFPGPPDSPIEEYTQEEKSALVGALIEKKILAVLPQR